MRWYDVLRRQIPLGAARYQLSIKVNLICHTFYI